MLKRCQIDPFAPEAHPFGLQQKALFHAVFTRQGDSSPRPEYTLPWQSGHLLQDLCHMPCTPGISRGFRDRTVRADLSTRNPANHSGNGNRQR